MAKSKKQQTGKVVEAIAYGRGGLPNAVGKLGNIGADDLVIVVPNLYAVEGVPSETGASFKLAASKGRFFWMPAEAGDARLHNEGGRIFLKLTVFRKDEDFEDNSSSAEKAKPTTPMSDAVF